MVKIPSKTSAKYLEKKFNKSEKYISYVKCTWWMEVGEDGLGKNGGQSRAR